MQIQRVERREFILDCFRICFTKKIFTALWSDDVVSYRGGAPAESRLGGPFCSAFFNCVDVFALIRDLNNLVLL
jgi:hypothetical protein